MQHPALPQQHEQFRPKLFITYPRHNRNSIFNYMTKWKSISVWLHDIRRMLICIAYKYNYVYPSLSLKYSVEHFTVAQLLGNWNVNT